jgi:hypothetical protein
MIDNVEAAKTDASSRPVVTLSLITTDTLVTLCGVDLILDQSVEYPGTPAMTVESKERTGCVTVS